MDIGLMSNVEYNVVTRRIEHSVNGNGQLNNSKIGSKVSAAPFDL